MKGGGGRQTAVGRGVRMRQKRERWGGGGGKREGLKRSECVYVSVVCVCE